MVGEQCKQDTCCGDRHSNKSKRGAAGSVTEQPSKDSIVAQPGNKNNSSVDGLGKQSALPGKLSLDMKFSPDGDEIVLEMSEIMKPVTEPGDESGSSKETLSPEDPAFAVSPLPNT